MGLRGMRAGDDPTPKRHSPFIEPPDSEFVKEFSKASQVSFPHGMEQLTQTLGNKLQEDDRVHILTGNAVERIEAGEAVASSQNSREHQQARRPMVVQLEGGDRVECDHVFSTLPAPALRRALSPADGSGHGGGGASEALRGLLRKME